MPPPPNGAYDDDAALSGLPSGAPCDAEELRRRSRRYLTDVGAALDSIESLLDSWTRLSEASAASSGVPERSDFRSVTMDVFTVLQPPPTVSEAEITRYIQQLSAKDRKALEDEFELTCVDDFEYVSSDEDLARPDVQAAARMVHFVDSAPEAVPCTAASDSDSDADTPEPVAPSLPVSVSPTTRARTLFEGDGTSLDRLGVNSIGRVTVVESQTPPAFSLEHMSPSAVAAQERRRCSASSESSPTSAGARTAPTAGEEAAASYTVEINYSADHFFPSAVQRALRDGAGGAIMITPSTHPAAQQATVTSVGAPAVSVEAEAPLRFGTDSEGSGAGDDIESFTTFSRMVLAKEGRRLTSQRARFEGSPRAEPDTQPPSTVRHEPSAVTPAEGVRAAMPSPPPPPPAAAAAHAAPAPAPAAVVRPAPAKRAKRADLQIARDAFVRQRVRDILLANRVRTADAATLGAAFFAKLDRGWKAAASQTTPVLHKLDDMLCESSALLHTLEVMDHQAYRQRVTDPTQFLCVPRYAVSCAAPDCATAFSATTTRVTCGRCGQPFCPACCVERGLGPDVVCDGQRYSLGWEPLCRLCFQMCRDSQRALVRRRHEYPRIADVAARSHAESDDAAEEVAVSASLETLTVKQAVLFGVYCDEQRCLGDGLPPFYVMDGGANEGVVFWDVLGYRLAKTQGTLRRGWQNAGNMASSALQSAAQMVSSRRAKLRST